MIRIIPIDLRKWFPPDDEVATAVAMLCILREDLLLELHGIGADKIEKLDENEALHRRTYFWRNSLRTLEEAKTTLNRVNKHRDFREALASQSEQTRNAFEEVKKRLNVASEELIRRLRSTVAAHLDHKCIQAGINAFGPTQGSLIQLADTLGNKHYRFSTDILWTAILGLPPQDKEAINKLTEVLRSTAATHTQVVKAIDDVFQCYVADRRLHRG